MKIALVSIRRSDPCHPIGLLCLHAYLKAHQPRHQVDIIDSAFEDPLQKILQGKYDLIGIGGMTADYESATILARNIRSSLKVPIIIGGVHISKLPESLRDCFDVGVIGEGEETMCELVELYERTSTPSPAELSSIKGLVFRDGEEIRQSPPRKVVELTDYPHLDYSVLHPGYFEKKAANSFGRFGVESFLMTSRGCPFKCVFCASSHFWDKVRYYSPEWVIGEMKALAARGADLIYIADDLFACNKKRLKAIGDLIRSEGLDKRIVFGCSGKTSVLDDETCLLLKAMNVQTVFFGFESGNQRVLDYLKCGTGKVSENKEAVTLCLSHGIECWGTVIIGSPDETLEEMEDTLRFIDWTKQNGVTRICVAVLNPLPGTPVWDTAMKRGKVSLDMNFDILKMESKEASDGLLVGDDIKAEFIQLRDRSFRHIHSFKWKKLRSFLRHTPWDTIKAGFGAPSAVIRRMFVPSEP